MVMTIMDRGIQIPMLAQHLLSYKMKIFHLKNHHFHRHLKKVFKKRCLIFNEKIILYIIFNNILYVGSKFHIFRIHL